MNETTPLAVDAAKSDPALLRLARRPVLIVPRQAAPAQAPRVPDAYAATT
jgi:hypothetical protein